MSPSRGGFRLFCPACRRVLKLASAFAILLSTPGASAAEFTWDGGAGADTAWSNGLNWSGDAAPANSSSNNYLFNSNPANLTLNNDLAGLTFSGGGGSRSLYFVAGAGAFVLTGNGVDLGGNIENRSASTPEVALDLTLTGTRTITSRNGGAGIHISGDIGGSQQLRIASFLGAEGAAVTLSGTNTYTGDTRILARGQAVLDFDRAGAPTSNIVDTGSRLRLTTGSLTVKGKNGGNTSQTFDGLLMDNSHIGALRVDQNGANSVDIDLGAIDRVANRRSWLDLTLPTDGTITTTSTATLGANNLLGSSASNNNPSGTTAFATVDGSTWATLDTGTGAIGALADLSYQTDFSSATGDTDVTSNLAPTSAVTANSLRFNSAAKTLTLDNAGVSTVTSGGILVTGAGDGSEIAAEAGGSAGITSGGTELMIINEANTFTVSAPIINTGTDRVIIGGSGTTILSGANTFSGETSVLYGATLDIRHASALGVGNNDTASQTLVMNGGALRLQGDLTVANERLALQGDGVNGGGTGALHSVSGDNAWNGDIQTQTGDARILTAADTLTIGGDIAGNNASQNRSISFTGGGDTIVNGQIGDLGTGRVVKLGSGTLTLNGNNLFDGTGSNLSDIYAGKIRAGHDNALGTSIVRLYGGGATLELANGIEVGNTIRIDNRQGNKTLALQDGATSGEFSGAITISEATPGQFDVSAGTDGTLTLSGDIDGTGAAGITKIGDGTVVLEGTNSYTGPTTVDAGTLQFAKLASLYEGDTGDWTTSNLIVKNGGTLAVNVGAGAGDEFNSGHLDTLIALGDGSGGFQSGSSIGLDTTNADGGNFTYGSDISDPNTGGNSLGLTKLGSGSLTLSGTNTYTGTTTVEEGTLALASSTLNNTIGSSSTIHIASGATLDVTGITTAGGFVLGATQTLTGTGSVTGATRIEGIHSPGNSPGVQSFDDDLIYDGASVTWELIGNEIGVRGTNYDGIDVDGNLDFISATTLDLVFDLTSPDSTVDWTNDFWDRYAWNSWLLYDVTGDIYNFQNLTVNSINWEDGVGGFFDSADNIPAGAGFFLKNTGSQIFLEYRAMPEPTTFGLLGLVLAGLTGFARPKRRRKLT